LFLLKYGHQVPHADIEIYKSHQVQEIDDGLLLFTHGCGQVETQAAQDKTDQTLKIHIHELPPLPGPVRIYPQSHPAL
jgi:hypothetical protein